MDKVAQNFRLIPDVLQGKILLEGKDGEVVSDYVFNLGKSDALSQIDYLNERKVTLAKQRDESAADYKKYSSLYVKIFFLLGVLMAVLLA